MVTKEQAMTARNFKHISMLNAEKKTPLSCRAMGKCKTWATRPSEFSLPVKYGLYNSFYITQDNAHQWNVA